MSRYQLFTVVCWDAIIENSLKRCLLFLRPPSAVPKSNVGKSLAHVKWLDEYICKLSMKS